jgi:hypothetical protein
MPWSAMRPGHRAFQGQVAMLPSRPDGFLTTPEAARLAGRTAATIRKWRQRGWLAPQGLDERYRPLHTAEAVRAAEQLVRQHGLEASGVDPRLLRKPPPLAA